MFEVWFNDKIINIFKILNKYNVTNQDTNEIFNKLVINYNNSWILERFDNLDMESQEVLSGIANNEVDTVQKQKSFLIKTKLKQLKMTGRRLLFETRNIYEPTIQRCFWFYGYNLLIQIEIHSIVAEI